MTLAAAKPGLKAGIEAAKKLAKNTSAPGPAGPEASDQEALAEEILEQMCTDITESIHVYAKQAKVVVKSDIGKVSSLIGDIVVGLLSGGDVATDGEATSYDSEGGGALGLTKLDDAKSDLYDGILDAYTSVMEAGVKDLEPSESTIDSDHIHDILATKFCDAVHAYLISAVVITTDEMMGGRTVSGGQIDIAGPLYEVPIMGVTVPTRDGLGDGSSDDAAGDNDGVS